MRKRKAQKALQTLVVHSPFEAAVSAALHKISTVDATKFEYARDVKLWLSFCREYRLDPIEPGEDAAGAWITWMKRHGHAPKSRARRISALSSVYRELVRRSAEKKCLLKVPGNPFSADTGPRREKVSVMKPTPLATHMAVRKTLEECARDRSPLAIRDAAIIHVFWRTGVRRISLLSMTWERLQPDPAGYIATVEKKGGETQAILICGAARVAFDRWLEVLRRGRLIKGPIWRNSRGEPLSARDVTRVLELRSKAVGYALSPHMLRVAFLTYNRASIAAKQDAAGHADPATTQLYDRTEWRGREAFEQMPEIEDL